MESWKIVWIAIRNIDVVVRVWNFIDRWCDIFIIKKILIVLQNVVGLVTGGASGLGRATAERLIAQGGRVVISDLPTSQGASVAKELGPNALFVPTDVNIICSL